MLLEDAGLNWLRVEDLMFKMCVFSGRKKRNSQQHQSSDRKSRRESVSSMSTTDVSGVTPFTQTSRESERSRESQSNNNTKGSQLSTSSTSSSLAGIRDLLPDGLIIYRYKELARATDNFSDSKKIGGSVFRASIRGADVAVVRKKGTFVGNYLELIKVICSIHHISLVKVLGACFRESEYVYLCYEYENGANLREALQSSKLEGFSVLSKWTSRLQIALDVALGLEYLHDHTMPTFVHKHIKSTNVLVTNDLRAKIAKFGIPQLIGEVPTSSSTVEPEVGVIEEEPAEKDSQKLKSKRKLGRSNSIKISGTPGYMAPEYMSSGEVTNKIDVYAYGVVLLELLSGQQPGVQYDPATKSFKVVSLPDRIKEVMDSSEPRKKLRLWMDPRLKDSFPVDTALSVAALAKQCIDADPALRPPMKNVAAKLSNYLAWKAAERIGAEQFSLYMSLILQPHAASTGAAWNFRGIRQLQSDKVLKGSKPKFGTGLQ